VPVPSSFSFSSRTFFFSRKVETERCCGGEEVVNPLTSSILLLPRFPYGGLFGGRRVSVRSANYFSSPLFFKITVVVRRLSFLEFFIFRSLNSIRVPFFPPPAFCDLPCPSDSTIKHFPVLVVAGSLNGGVTWELIAFLFLVF